MNDSQTPTPLPEPDPQMAAILARMNAAGLKSYQDMTVEEARIEQERRNAYWNEKPPAIAKVEDIKIEGAFGMRDLRVFDPDPMGSKRRPGIFYLHGGGFVIGSPRSHDVIARNIALHSGLPVFSYDYVMAPEHPFPQPVQDSIAAYTDLLRRAADFRLEPRLIGIAGDSAGAALSLNVAMARRDAGQPPPAAMALVYPVATMSMSSGSHRLFGGDGYLLSTEQMRWFLDQYVQDPSHHGDPRLELISADLHDLPPAYVSVAELDPLRDEGDALFDRLREHGSDVEYCIWRGVTHACLPMGRDLDRAQRYLREIADFFCRRLNHST